MGIGKLALHSSFHQLSYLFFATWGLLGVLVAVPILRWKALPVVPRGTVLFLAICTAGMVAFLSFAMRGDRAFEYWMPFGRYLSVLCPSLVVFALYLLQSPPTGERTDKRYLIATTALFAVVAALATPLTAVIPRSIVDAPDLALVMFVIDRGEVIWRKSYEATRYAPLRFAALFAGVALIGIFTANSRRAFYGFVALLLVSSLMTTLAEQHYINMLGTSQSPMNNAVRFLREPGADFAHAVGIDRRFKGGNIRPMADFWTTSRLSLRYVAADELVPAGPNADLRYFVSPELLTFPIAFEAPGIYVYLLNGRKSD